MHEEVQPIRQVLAHFFIVDTTRQESLLMHSSYLIKMSHFTGPFEYKKKEKKIVK